MFAVQTKCLERKVSHACIVRSNRQERLLDEVDLHTQRLLLNNQEPGKVNGLEVSLSGVGCLRHSDLIWMRLRHLCL